jgi:metallophosphoesterase (TIGR03767 family)
MAYLDRRRFLKLSAAAAAGVPFAGIPDVTAVAAYRAQRLTTLQHTIVKGGLVTQGSVGAYYRLKYGPGEPHLVRTELGKPSRSPIVWGRSFVQVTDVHLADTQSPARVEFLDREADEQCDSAPLDAAFRPQETLTTRVLEAMIRRIRRIGAGAVTGRPFQFVIATGDNIDNQQYNELRWFIDTMDGGKLVAPDSGDTTKYEGVQAEDWGDPEYWHPDPVPDKYKEQYGFPDYPGLLGDATAAFQSRGLGIPWWQTFGNHDGLVQGNKPRDETINQIATGPVKVTGQPPGANPCNPFPTLPTSPSRPVAADPYRFILRRSEYVGEHFKTMGHPRGHGFGKRNLDNGVAYYVRNKGLFRYIMLDTVNPGGYADGSIGQTQFNWLERKLQQVHGSYFDASGTRVRTRHKDRLVVLFSHHGLRSLNNQIQDPNPDDPDSNDLPRITASEIEALVHRFPNVIAWVNGHTHNNIIDPRPDPSQRTPGFWDIGTSALVEWTCQSRIVEIAIRRDRTISIFCTVVDTAAPPDPAKAAGLLRLASIHRELAANDYQFGFDSKGAGKRKDRNVELLIPAPKWLDPDRL